MPKRYISRDGELYHAQHKYKSRKWKNGRWVYTYEDPKPKKSIFGRKITVQRGSISADTAKDWVDAAKSQKKAAKKAERSEKVKKFVDKYVSSPISKLKTAINKGKAVVEKLVSKAKDKLKNPIGRTTTISSSTVKYYSPTAHNSGRSDSSNATAKRKSSTSAASGAKGIASTTRTKPSNMSQEYWDELNYNSGRSTTSSTKSSTQTKPKNASSEYLEELEYNKKRNKYR